MLISWLEVGRELKLDDPGAAVHEISYDVQDVSAVSTDSMR